MLVQWTPSLQGPNDERKLRLDECKGDLSNQLKRVNDQREFKERTGPNVLLSSVWNDSSPREKLSHVYAVN